MIRVLVVDDSLTVRKRLVEILERDGGFLVVGEASDGVRAVELATSLRPDVITLDIVMPEMSGLAVTEHIMAHQPTPILIVSSSFNRGEVFDTYAALSAGAVDALDKSDVDDDAWDARFVSAVRMVAKIKVITHPRGRLGTLGRARVTSPGLTRLATVAERDVIAIGASTGGPGALSTVLGAIVPDMQLPILVVLHIDARFATAFVDWLAGTTRRAVRFARAGESIDAARGQVLLAPAGAHLATSGRRVELRDTPARNHCKPSIDVMFESLAQDYGRQVAACILTGMGRDGAAGLLAIRRAGGLTIGQDEASCVVYGMPREAKAIGAVERELAIDDIAPALSALRGRA